MKKKTAANIVMVAIIAVIAAAGILAVGHIQGWFDKPSEDMALLTQFRGIITLERDGVAFTTTEDTVLRSGDQITCDPGSTVRIVAGDGYITLGQSAVAKIVDPSADSFAVDISGGEAFVNTAAPMTVFFDGKEAVISEAVANVSVRSGAQSITVYSGTVEEARSGQMLEWIGGQASVRDCPISSLNDFNIAQLRVANKSVTLCFTNEDLDQLEADRWAEKQAQLITPTQPDTTEPPEPTVPSEPEETTVPSEPEETVTPTEPEETTAPTEPPQPTVPSEPEETAAPTEPPETARPTDPPATAPAQTEPPATTAPPETTAPPVTEPKLTCTITIRCDTILDNWDELDPAKAAYVPSSGCILPVVTVEFEEGETVFDVLKRVCTTYGIQIEYSWTPMYDSYYIEGINNLYEFDCGYESGWMYKVNGWFPNYGCSSYTLTGGESIVWCFTCHGYGTDVGAPEWE